MRMIDADALMRKFKTASPMAIDGRARQIVEEMPTIEERKTGKWIVFSSPDEYHCGLVKCPFCSEELIAEANEYNYCPNCGARMENSHDSN